MDLADLGLPSSWGLWDDEQQAATVDESEPSRYVVSRVQGNEQLYDFYLTTHEKVESMIK